MTKKNNRNSPDRSVGVHGTGFNHVPGLINIFLNIKRSKRHSTSEPQRSLREVEPRTYKTMRSGSIALSVQRWSEEITLTDPPSVAKHDRTRVNLRTISQEPFGIELHRVGIGSRVMSNLPVRSSQPTEPAEKARKFLLHQSQLTRGSQSVMTPWE